MIQLEGAPAHVVHDPAGGADDDVGAFFEQEQLFLNGLAAIDWHRFDARLVFGELADLLAGLHGQFPGGGEDQHLDMLFFWVDPFHSRDAEGSGLAGAGVGAADDIPPGQN